MSARRARPVATPGVVLRYGRDGDVAVRLDDGVDAWARGLVPGDEGTFVRTREGRRELVVLERLTKPSEHRVSPRCPLVDRCGGCPMGVVAPSFAHEVKRSAVVRALGDAALAPDAVRFVPSPSEHGYRRRARLSFERRGRELALGYRPFRSDRVLDVPSCPVLVPVLDEVLSVLRTRLVPNLVGAGEVRLALGVAGRPVVALRSAVPQSAAVYDALSALVHEGVLAGAALFVGEGTAPARFGDPVERTPALDGSELRGSVDGFSQANDAVALAMAETVRDFASADGARVLELYAGHGHLGIALAARAARFVAVEQAKEAAESLRANLRARGLEGKVITDDAERAPRDPVDVVVLDPPRTGAADALPVVLAASPRRVVVASCDPRTLERDLRVLRAAGFVPTDAVAFDMFPGTPHVEAVVRLTRDPDRA